METITIRTREKGQMDFLRALLANLRWDAEVEYGGVRETPDGLWEKAGEQGELPAVMTVDELRAEVAGAEEELRNGKCIRHEHLMEELKAWI